MCGTQVTKVYGTDFTETSDEKIKEEIKNAYDSGYREFDCAYTYAKLASGGTIFDGLQQSEREQIQIIYKYKHENLEAAEKQLELIASKGIKILSVMLHEIPVGDLEEPIEKLRKLCNKYSAGIGISNIGIGDTELHLLKKIFEGDHSHEKQAPVIENRVNLLSPDTEMRQYAKKHGIRYIGYGLFGSKPSVGTCTLPAEQLNEEEYNLMYDPILKKKAEELNKSVVFIIAYWAEQQKIDTIMKSGSKEKQLENFRSHDIEGEHLNPLFEKFATNEHINWYLNEKYSEEELKTLNKIISGQLVAYYKSVCCTQEYNLAIHKEVLQKIQGITDPICTEFGQVASTIQKLIMAKDELDITLYSIKNINDLIKYKRFSALDDECYMHIEELNKYKKDKMIVRDELLKQTKTFKYDFVNGTLDILKE